MKTTVRERVSVQINRLKGLKTEDGSRQINVVEKLIGKMEYEGWRWCKDGIEGICPHHHLPLLHSLLARQRDSVVQTCSRMG